MLNRIAPWIFKCRHRRMSFPLTIKGATYRACLDCGAMVEYDFAKMEEKKELCLNSGKR